MENLTIEFPQNMTFEDFRNLNSGLKDSVTDSADPSLLKLWQALY